MEHFLELCLSSVYKASEGLEVEVWVVDNHSSDGSLAMIEARFPAVKLIANEQNTGFSVANNQAIRKAKGEFILLLNPDTVVAEDTLRHCLEYMELHPQAGALGARMLDGSGRFLPESKRGLPTPWVSFCKAFGLHAFFPKSKNFGGYYLSYLSEKETHEVDVLSGAFMFIRKEALSKSGLLDEQFFMYGEDVDLSFRLQQAGFKNMYFPPATILHFKGESTKRGSISFVMHFYRAMLLFSRKHFSNSALFSFFIYLGIAVRAMVALCSRFMSTFGGTILEFGIAYAGMVFIKNWWEINFKHAPGLYPDYFIEWLIPGYLLAWIGATRLVGWFSERYGLASIIKGIALGTLIISGITNFFDDYRFSKGLILIGAVWTWAICTGRFLVAQWLQRTDEPAISRRRRILALANEEGYAELQHLLNQFNKSMVLTGWLSADPSGDGEHRLGSLTDLRAVLFRLSIDEIVITLGGIPVKKALEIMEWMAGTRLRFSYLAPGSQHIVGSSEKHSRGNVYQAESVPAILLPHNRRWKRLTDACILALFPILLPVILLKGGRFSRALKHWKQVFTGEKTWIGLHHNILKSYGHKSGIITMKELAGPNASDLWIQRLDQLYLAEFNPLQEFWTILKNLRFIG